MTALDVTPTLILPLWEGGGNILKAKVKLKQSEINSVVVHQTG
jgi:hypothetical protein